jgi:large subunit ribosomal protein L1
MAKATTKNVPNDELDAMLDTPEEQAAVNEVIAEADNIPEISEGVSEDTPTTTAKAGKRSAKALEEVAAKEAKEERKASGEEAEAKPKQHANPTRPRVERQGKKFQTSAKLVEVDKLYALGEAIALAQKTSHVKFDATVELHINLGVDPRHADQNIRDNLVLPAGTGRTVRIAVLTDDPITAIAAGANVAGTDEVLAQLDKGLMNFDILISTPALMAKLGKFARVLGPRGLMPNPKSGTVTTDVTKAVNEAKAGKVEYRVDSTGSVHLGIGKVSFTAAQLNDNAQAVLTSIKNNKPASVKGNYFKAIHMTTSMGPSIAVDISAAS